MKTPIGNRNPYNILHVVFFFLPNHSVFEETIMEICYPCHLTLYRVNRALDREFSVNNINLCEKYVVNICYKIL